MTSSKVPCRCGSSDIERGKISYQALKRRALPVDDERQLARVAREVGADSGALHQRRGAARGEKRQARALIPGRVDLRKERLQRRFVGRRGARALLQRALDERAAFGQLQRDRHAGGVFLFDLVAPAREEVAPGNQRIVIMRVGIDDDRSAPAVVVEESHRHFAPFLLVAAAKKEGGVDLVMTVAEDVGLDDEAVADRGLGRKAAPVDFRRYVFDRDAACRERGERRLGL